MGANTQGSGVRARWGWTLVKVLGRRLPFGKSVYKSMACANMTYKSFQLMNGVEKQSFTTDFAFPFERMYTELWDKLISLLFWRTGLVVLLKK